jgi:hypothetical protein
MKTQIAAGPVFDVAFFAKLRAVFDEYPDVGQKYSVHFLHDEIGGVPVDFSKKYAASRVEGDRIVTEFRDNSELTRKGSIRACCEWRYYDGRWQCIRQCLE